MGASAFAFLFTAALALPAAARGENGGFEADRYPEFSAAAIVASHPCRPGPDGYEVKDVPFSLRAEYRPGTRAESKERLELVKRWSAKLNAAGQADRFTRELRMGSGASAPWAAVTQDLIDAMRKELKFGETAWFYMSFIGCVGQEPAFAIDEFEAADYDDLDDAATSYIT